MTKSILAVPLRAKGKLIGVVEAINKESDQIFTPEDQEAFGVFASQAGIAIENARLFSAVDSEKRKLSTVFSEMSGLIQCRKGPMKREVCCSELESAEPR